MKFQVLLLMIFTTFFSCSAQKTNDMKEIKLYQENIKYPYKVSKEREETILGNMNKLSKGMTKEEVIESLTNPDEANLTYKSIKKGSESTGFSFVYLLRRDKASDKNEKYIRIHFDDAGKLISCYANNIPSFNEIEK